MAGNVLKFRMKMFALNVIRLTRQLPNTREGRLIGDQLFRSGTSVAANYRAACRARSKAEFLAKLGVVEEEADETLFWLELISDLQLLNKKILFPCQTEANELLSITIASIKTARKTK